MDDLEFPAGMMVHPEASEEAQIVFLQLEAGQAALCRRCWDKTALSQLVHCSNACHFCRTCVRQHARLRYSASRYWLGCICAEGTCQGRLSQSDLGKFLPRYQALDDQMMLVHVAQMKDVIAAEIKGLEWCPLCPFATVVEYGLRGSLVCSMGCGTWEQGQSRAPIFIAEEIVPEPSKPSPVIAQESECAFVVPDIQEGSSKAQGSSSVLSISPSVTTSTSTLTASASTSASTPASSEPPPPYVPKTIVCACCFDDDPLLETTQCSKGCVFCLDCARKYAETRIEESQHTLPCMSTTACKGLFTDKEAILFLSRTSFARLEQLRQDYEIEQAQIPGLEKCPFCPYAVVLDPHHGRIFQCLMPDCAISSCRRCMREDHSPMTCKEAAEHKPAQAIHKVAEAMSDALIRRCPNLKCGKTFIKEHGCNHVVCTACRTESCFVCGVLVKGYGHWQPPSASCPLFDDGDMADRVSGNVPFPNLSNPLTKSPADVFAHPQIESAWRFSTSLVLQENPEIDERDLESLRLVSKWNPSRRR
ncbi:BZ3500_MvSof-1268-A1-R1_Chr11-1g03184 [Microbotryum saponariae]|uniref:BZ3500_MvSof-1268-A1-R1_Chr11-1g03184 protein n=1 Tax=Microbotryum saponariae TaxID=289078 RepID=A0A2X0LA61_9BASI|nr:BZ3501_MvSof-1269-A2-R1_Chr11g02759 [Microbotryum saponariae]SDA03744.1 BZ3500_MvSof-1268-A1-R1_Chr11-1g03184 [Microbotryum saponariae]